MLEFVTIVDCPFCPLPDQLLAAYDQARELKDPQAVGILRAEILRRLENEQQTWIEQQCGEWEVENADRQSQVVR